VFARGDFEQLAGMLAVINGRFLLSLNDTPPVRRIFAAFRIERLEATYTIAGGAKAARFAELLISDRKPPLRPPSERA
jgi:DNA adenine methylase